MSSKRINFTKKELIEKFYPKPRAKDDCYHWSELKTFVSDEQIEALKKTITKDDVPYLVILDYEDPEGVSICYIPAPKDEVVVFDREDEMENEDEEDEEDGEDGEDGENEKTMVADEFRDHKRLKKTEPITSDSLERDYGIKLTTQFTNDTISNHDEDNWTKLYWLHVLFHYNGQKLFNFTN